MSRGNDPRRRAVAAGRQGPPLIEGRADPGATADWARRAVGAGHVAPDHYAIGPGDLRLSSIGLGTYLGAADAATDLAVEQALAVCWRSRRVNVVDTAINYRAQRAERSVGRALARAIDAGHIARDQLFLATKSGYLAPDGESPLRADEWIRRELVGPGIVRPSEIVEGNVLSVRYLQDQLTRSLTNLGVGTIDLLYLHNSTDAQLPTIGRTAFGGRLAEAFAFLEGERRAGRVGCYGLATWDSLRAPRSDAGYWSIEETLAIARDVGGADHGCRFVQFPFNAAMPEAAVLRNQPVDGERLTLFDAARRLGVGCLTNVPLLQGQLVREGPRFDGLGAAESALQFARSAPGTTGALVGQKTPEHLAENLAVCARPRWSAERFRRALD